MKILSEEMIKSRKREGGKACGYWVRVKGREDGSACISILLVYILLSYL